MMKLAFSTLGCPDWTWDDIYAIAKDMGLNGIELRGVEKQIYVPGLKMFSPEHIDNTLKRIKGAGMEIPMLTSSCCLGLDTDTEKYLNEAREYIDLASKIGTPYIRVMITPVPEATPADLVEGKKRYQELCDYAAGKDVRVLIETNGPLSKSTVMADFIKDANPQTRGVLWDIHHPYRYFGETPEYTYSVLKDYIYYTHVKDSVLKDGKVQYRMMGYGDVPIFDALKTLSAGGYEGYVSLEWVKRWNPDLEEPGIVFSHFYSYMKTILATL